MENLKYTEILQLNKELSKESYNSEFSAKILSNVTVNSFKEIVEYSLRLKKINPIIEIGNFDNIVQDSVSSSNHNLVFVFYDILNIVDNVTSYFESLDEGSILELEQKIKSETAQSLESAFKKISDLKKDDKPALILVCGSLYFAGRFLGTN